MTRIRLRETAQQNTEPYRHDKWPEHRKRVEWTIEHGVRFTRYLHACAITDLSCGDAVIPLALWAEVTQPDCPPYLGTLVDRDDVNLNVVGPIEETIRLAPPTDLFVCTETIEHLEDPDTVLREIRRVAFGLLLTTPVAEDSAIENWEHLWSWDEDDVRDMLDRAGFRHVVALERLECDFYTYQLWCVT